MLREKKVILRPVKRSDLPNFLKWFNDPEILQYRGMYLPMIEMGGEQIIENLPSIAAERVILVIEVIGDKANKPIGTVALEEIHAKDHRATLGITIGEKDYWSKGYGTEAAGMIIDYGFKQLNLHRISSDAFSFNERSIRLHKRIGFKEEGRRRQRVFKNGQYCDDVEFGLLRSEWKGLE